MKSIDMYILHDSSLVVCFSNISAYFAQREVIKVLRSGARVKVKVKVVAGGFTLPRSHGCSRSVLVAIEF